MTTRGAAWLALLCLAPLAAAGTREAPEVRDPAGDQALLGAVPLGTTGPTTADDLVAAWVDGETAASLTVHLQLAGPIAPTPSSIQRYVAHLSLGGQGFDAVATLQPAPLTGDGSLAPGGVASAASVAGSVLNLTIPRSALGAAAAGAHLTDLWAFAEANLPGDPIVQVRDRAPDAGAGADYVLTGGAPGPAAQNAGPAPAAEAASAHHRSEALAASALVSTSATLLAALAGRSAR